METATAVYLKPDAVTPRDVIHGPSDQFDIEAYGVRYREQQADGPEIVRIFPWAQIREVQIRGLNEAFPQA